VKPDVVVDVGNSRIKWGRCSANGIWEAAYFPVDSREAWQAQVDHWFPSTRPAWALCGSGAVGGFREWIESRGDPLLILSNSNLPLDLAVDFPDQVGIDRLLNAVAAKFQGPGPAVIIDAGTAVTVDWLDEQGVFRGGSIFPGFRLMTQSLCDYTARLPLVTIEDANPLLPGTNTRAAITAGVYWAVAGGITALVQRLTESSRWEQSPRVFLTGGDARLVASLVEATVWPYMTLEGIRLSALAQP
jgi:type III pantothenate kinase